MNLTSHQHITIPILVIGGPCGRERFGIVESCCVIRDVSTNSSRGFGFVKFVHVHQAEVAIQAMHGKQVRGRALEVKFANSDSSATTAGPARYC